MRKMRKYQDYLIETLQDPEEATAYLQVTLEEYMADNTEAFLLALRTVAEAQGGLSELARRTRLSAESLSDPIEQWQS